ncbi:MAG TPA: peroxiredoxin [Candidatus Acidoferrales bacterium]|nr:peroxiredoxin [Candidatus Acidoferrales bacterium]
MKRNWWLTLLVVVGLHSSAMAKMLEPGEKFPAWQLPDQTGAQFSSSQLAGTTYLLWFYPKAMGVGCTAEGNGLRDSYAELTAKQVTVIGVSFDAPFTNLQFIRRRHYPFRLLSDTDRKLALAVGAADSPSQSVSRRMSYLIGPDGKVRKAYAGVNPANHAKQVLADVSSSPTESK